MNREWGAGRKQGIVGVLRLCVGLRGLSASAPTWVQFPHLGFLLFLPYVISISKVFMTNHVTISNFSLELWFLS